MGFITGTLIVLGVGAAIWGTGKVIEACNEPNDLRAEIQKLEAENKQLSSTIDYVNGIKTKLQSAKEHLESSRKDFKNGGWVNADIPLANNEFSLCIGKLDAAISSAESFVSDLNSTIEKNNKDIASMKKRIGDIDRQWKEASKKQHELRGGTRGTSSTKNSKTKPKHR